jgi:hypothetical protein
LLGNWARCLANEEKKDLYGGQHDMLLYELTSVIVGSVILAGLFVSIAIRKPRTIIALNNNWQKIKVSA